MFGVTGLCRATGQDHGQGVATGERGAALLCEPFCEPAVETGKSHDTRLVQQVRKQASGIDSVFECEAKTNRRFRSIAEHAPLAVR